MKSIFVASLSAMAGKNLICLGLFRRLSKDGHKTGFFKPIGIYPTVQGDTVTDEDVVFFRRTLDLKDNLRDLCPNVMTADWAKELIEGNSPVDMARTQKAFTTISKDKDIVVINGLGSLSSGIAFGLSGYEVIKKFKSQVVLVDKARPLNNLLDDMLQAREELKGDLMGVVINNIPLDQHDYYTQHVGPYLQKNLKINVLGVIPEDPTLGAVSVEEALNVLQGELLCGKEKRAELVETYSIGAQNVESALRTFRKIKNKAVITGGDRSDIQLAAMETSTTLLVLTGGHYPNEIIVSRAQTMGCPIVVVRYDTKTAVDRMNGILGHVSLRNASKAKQATNVVQRYIDFGAVYKGLGLTMVEK